jgi:hypothetical protein
MTLRDLSIGDRFIAASAKNKQTAERFTVVGSPEFNFRAGTATRQCTNDKREIFNKQCRLPVIKIGPLGAP